MERASRISVVSPLVRLLTVSAVLACVLASEVTAEPSRLPARLASTSRVQSMAPALDDEQDVVFRAIAGQGPATAGCRPGSLRSHEACIAQLNQAGEREFVRILADYEAELRRDPSRAAIAVERCRFIQRAALEEIETTSPREAAFERCMLDLGRRYADSPEVKILELEQRFGETAARYAEELLVLAPSPFSNAQRADILEYAARQLQFSNPDRASEFARRAMAFDDRRQLATIAAAALRKSAPDAAAELLLGSVDQLRDPQVRIEAATMLFELGYAPAAVSIFDALAREGTYLNRLSYARALAGAGQSDRARTMFAQAAEQLPWLTGEILRERYAFELDYGSSEQALASYRALRDTGFQSDPLLRRRADLFMRAPDLPFDLRDLLGLGALLGFLAIGFVAGAIVLFPIHYIGLLNGRRHREDFARQRRFGLSHLWLAVGVLASLELAAAWVMSYELLAGYFGPTESTPNDPLVWARVTLVSAPLGLLAMLCMLRRSDLVGWTRSFWSPARSVALGALASLLVLSISVLNFAALSGLGFSIASISSQDVVVALFREYGLAAFVGVVVVAAPLSEELLFREIGLRALSRYINFPVANLLQAAVFASMHQDPLRFVPLFALGALAGWLRLRSGGLLAPIMLHATNNAIAVVAIAAV